MANIQGDSFSPVSIKEWLFTLDRLNLKRPSKLFVDSVRDLINNEFQSSPYPFGGIKQSIYLKDEFDSLEKTKQTMLIKYKN